jgi:[acyl-carrier-protein] S-malonyltransferase
LEGFELQMNHSESTISSSSIAALFPGQGSQHVGMGKDLYDNFAIARQAFEEASDAIRLDLKKLCFNGTESDLTLTENTQPSLLVTSVAAFRVVEQEFGFLPGIAAGHSLGEYSALVATGSLDLGIAAKWVKERGAAMQRAVPAGEGTMAAIMGMEDAQIQQLCEKATQIALQKRQEGESADNSVPVVVEPANFNAPGQIVIAGSVDGVQEAVQLVKSGGDFAGSKAIPLQVSAPFHCRLMKPARERMAELFSQATPLQKPKTPRCPYLPNRTARISLEPGMVFELLVDQVDHPVLWKQSMKAVLDAQFSITIEFGPGKVLSGLMKRIASPLSKNCTSLSIGDSLSLKNLETLLKNNRT